MPLAHPFLYASPRRHADRPIHIALPRDSEANAELRIALHEQGYGFGRSILNLPPPRREFRLLPFDELRRVELPFLDGEALLFCTTRPPLSEYVQDDKKKVEPSNTTLEHAIFVHYWRYFDRCSRSSIKFTEEAAACLPEGKKNRGEMSFNQIGCLYQSLGTLGGKRVPPGRLGNRTAAFLLSVEELWPGGPGLKAAWGLNAIATLIWCLLLRDRYSALLANRGLTVVELQPADPPIQPDTHEWAYDCPVTPLMETKVELPPRAPKTTIDHSYMNSAR